ncbi:MAG TPA: hypothetical protein VMJ75_25020 [Candidatus Acidoferrales bacterium]|nr:hypothetical protein [Candidatus Acidoferrales bacterium]
MRSLILTVLLTGGSLHASSIYQCSFNGGGYSVAGCYSTTSFINTNDSLDWGNQNGTVTDGSGSGFGSAINNSYNVGINDTNPWVTHTANGSIQVGVGIMPTSFSGTAQIDRVDNLGYAQLSDGTYTLSNNVPGLDSFGGQFGGQPNSSSQYAGQTDYSSVSMGGVALSGYQGDHLIRLDGSSSGILITFSQPVYRVGLRVSAMNDTQTTMVGSTAVQDLKIQAYNITDPANTSHPFLSYELQDSGGYGTCAPINTLSGGPPGTPTPCNAAPFIGIDATSSLFTTAPLVTLPNNPWISSVFISSTDNVGFLLDELFIQDMDPDAAPEPAMFILIGSGLLALGAIARYRR